MLTACGVVEWFPYFPFAIMLKSKFPACIVTLLAGRCPRQGVKGRVSRFRADVILEFSELKLRTL